MHGQAQVWWESNEREVMAPWEIITWDMFLEELENKCISSVVKDKRAIEFTNLVQGSMTIIEYDTEFEELPKYASNTILAERDEALKFQRGWTKDDIKVRVAPLALETYVEALKRAQWIEEEIGDESGPQS